MKRALVTLLLFFAPLAARGSTVVVLPLDNVSGEQAAEKTVPALIVKAIEAKGWTIAGGTDIEALLEKERVRYLDSLDANVRNAIIEKSGANAILSVTVYIWTQGRNPVVGLSAHLIDADGATTWANVAGLTSADTERALGFGKSETVDAVAAEAVDLLMRNFPKPGQRGSIVRGPSRPLHLGRPASFRAPGLDTSQRICILPFDNASNVADASRVLADVLALRFTAAGFDVVDPAVLRAAALEARVSFHDAGSQDLGALSKIVGTPLFLHGTIYAFDDPTMRGGSGSPAIDVEATLVDAAAGKVLWAAQNNRKGTDYIGFLMLGAVSNSLSLTDRVASEMIATARTNHETAKPSADRAAVASAGRKSRQQHHAGESKR